MKRIVFKRNGIRTRVVDLIQTGSDPTTDHENTRQTLQVMDAIESLSGDSVIDLADPSG
jgi:hypothetical protein